MSHNLSAKIHIVQKEHIQKYAVHSHPQRSYLNFVIRKCTHFSECLRSHAYLLLSSSLYLEEIAKFRSVIVSFSKHKLVCALIFSTDSCTFLTNFQQDWKRVKQILLATLRRNCVIVAVQSKTLQNNGNNQ